MRINMGQEIQIVQDRRSQKKLMIASYALFAAGLFLGGLSVIAAVILIYIKRRELTEFSDHCAYLLRTFWGVCLLWVIALLTFFIGVGIIIASVASIWFIFRVVYGAVKLFDDQGVTATGWLV